jgi:hypothetical protein
MRSNKTTFKSIKKKAFIRFFALSYRVLHPHSRKPTIIITLCTRGKLKLPNPTIHQNYFRVAFRHISNKKRRSTKEVVRETKSIFDCSERERDERNNAICTNEEHFLSPVQNRRREPGAECSKTRRSDHDTFLERRVVLCSTNMQLSVAVLSRPHGWSVFNPGRPFKEGRRGGRRHRGYRWHR